MAKQDKTIPDGPVVPEDKNIPDGPVVPEDESKKTNLGEEEMANTEDIKVKLKSTYPKKDKDGNVIGRYEVDDTISLPSETAKKLISNGMAVEV